MQKIFFILSISFSSLFFIEKNTVDFTGEISYNNHSDVFDYLSEPENFQDLNPTIFRLEIIFRNECEFSIKYDEYLSHFPLITNLGSAHYKIENEESGGYKMTSTHLTCFLRGYFCLSTFSTLWVTKSGISQVIYEEEINYSCPWIMKKFCFEEILFQRMAIMNRLEMLFTSKGPK